MATDVEESDTDERERPGPSCKRQRILSPRTDLDSRDEDATLQRQEQQLQSVPEDTENSVADIDDELDRRSREKLLIWQSRQFTTGCVDDAINKVLENYVMFPPNSYPFEDPWYCLLRGNRMEDAAVTMAIHNHGVFRTLELHHSPSHDDERVSTVPEVPCGEESPLSNTSTETLMFSNSETSTSDEGDWLNNMCDNEHREDFLDRAVAEAIKKKGLSTLSADYG